MKKILFVPCGIGLGHATRTWAIMQEVKNKASIRAASYGAGYEFLSKKNVTVDKIRGPEFKGEKSFDWLLTINNSWDLPFRLIKSNVKLRKVIRDFEPDMIFSDSDPSGFLAANLNRKTNYMLTNLPTILFEKDNLSEAWVERYRKQIQMIEMINDPLLKYADRIFIPSFKEYKLKSEKYMEIHPIIRKQKEELPSKRKLKEKLELREEFYLVAFPGSEVGSKRLIEVLSILKDFNDKNFVVLNHPSGKKGKRNNMEFLTFVDNFLEYLKLSKGVISLGGHSTISEALTYKKPLLTFPIKNHIEQMVNSDILRRERLGAAFFGEYNEERIKNKLRDFFESISEYREELKKRNIRGNGSSQVADFLLSQ